ncbi:hypothetical protein PG994_005095 [Apiospora phragmitis]|uniref:Uncharacterized protein n=1 Tax=Apiospora phragmitis TaxID=2905665 RepID=A0ABR1VV56_9PEZI
MFNPRLPHPIFLTYTTNCFLRFRPDSDRSRSVLASLPASLEPLDTPKRKAGGKKRPAHAIKVEDFEDDDTRAGE